MNNFTDSCSPLLQLFHNFMARFNTLAIRVVALKQVCFTHGLPTILTFHRIPQSTYECLVNRDGGKGQAKPLMFFLEVRFNQVGKQQREYVVFT